MEEITSTDCDCVDQIFDAFPDSVISIPPKPKIDLRKAYDSLPTLQQELEEAKQLEERSDGVMVISIDPGFSNMALCVGHYRIEKGLDTWRPTIRLTWDRKRMSVQNVVGVSEDFQVETYVENIRKWLLKNFSENDFKKPAIVIIEKQWISGSRNSTPSNWFVSMKLKTIETIIYTIFREKYQVITKSIASHVYKKQLGINAGRHHINKKKATEFAMECLGENHPYLSTAKNDHIADCMNQAYYHIKFSNQETFKRIFDVIVDIQ